MNTLLSIREKQNISQSELARILEISPQRLNQYEKGKRKLPISLAFKIANTFNITLEDIFLPNN